MRKIIILFLILLPISSRAYNIIYTSVDSIRIERMLCEARELPSETNYMLHFAKAFLGTPYVAHTLDCYPEENLVVNLSGMDCTTFMETVLSLSLCSLEQKTSFRDFCNFLRMIRYSRGEVSYLHRNHYLSGWIEENEKQGFVSSFSPQNTPALQNTPAPTPPHSCPAWYLSTWSKEKTTPAIQRLNINYMSTHVKKYTMLTNHPEWIAGIKEMEKAYCGKEHAYIPKHALFNTEQLRETISDGDILPILTSIPGLDTSHVGIALWKDGKLFLLRASSRWKKVVIEPQPLSLYMKSQPKQIGIRVVKIAKNRQRR